MQGKQLDNDSAGFTLLELMVVIGVVSVLLGVGLGYLGKTNPNMVARSILAGQIRAAQMTARAEGVPTEVRVRQGVDSQAASVQSRLLEPVVAFHFEPNTPVLDERLRPVLGGMDVPYGRFGHARRPMDGDKHAVVHWPVSPDVIDVREGFVLRLDLFLEHREACVLIDMPPLLEVRLDSELRPDARLRLSVVGGNAVRKSLACELALPLQQWSTLEFGCDGRWLWLSVDGREFGRIEAQGTPHQVPEMELDISPVMSPLPGMVDEFRLMMFRFSSPQLLPIELQPIQDYRLTFDKRGEPVEAPEIVYEDLEDGS